MKIYIFDNNNYLIGYAENNKLFNAKDKLIKEIKDKTVTIKELRDILINAEISQHIY